MAQEHGKYEIRNARITKTMLGFEDHGLFTFMIDMYYGTNEAQGYGGYTDTPAGMLETIKEILKVTGVEKWEDLKGQYVRVYISDGFIRSIGKILEGNNQWVTRTMRDDDAETLGVKKPQG